LKKLDIYTDGAAKGNPGPAGVGVVICDSSGYVLKNISKYIGEATNNVAEYSALIYALQEALILKAEAVRVWTDSELLYKQINGDYKVRHENLKPLFEQIKHLSKGFISFEISYISRHNNRGADKLANQAVVESKNN
jgi:ribonuclease HI